MALLGARQVGKSTLAQGLASNEFPASYISLDEDATAATARADPTGFIADVDRPTVIDEIQRAPGLLLAIKQRLDSNQARGQFLLTGSANILTLPTIADALPGRVEYINLWPFSQGELRGIHEGFIDMLLRGEFPKLSEAPVGRRAIATMLVTGGYPALQGRSLRGRVRFFSSYLASILDRDLPDVASVRSVESVARLFVSSRPAPRRWRASTAWAASWKWTPAQFAITRRSSKTSF